MRGMSLVAAAVAIGACALAAGCGQQHITGTAPATPKAEARCVTPKLALPGRTFTITDKDNGKSFCVVTGTGVFVFLHGSPARMWAHLRPSSAAVQPRPNGRLALMVGETGGYFVTTRSGDVVLTSSRNPCHASAGSTAHCTGQSYFEVTLVIGGQA
jgi:hypothetical protein